TCTKANFLYCVHKGVQSSGLARMAKTLSPTAVKGLKVDTVRADAQQPGLQLVVRTRADGRVTRSWVLSYKFKRRANRLVLGHYPEVTLEAARQSAKAL